MSGPQRFDTGDRAFDEDSQSVQTVDFPYDEVDAHLAGMTTDLNRELAIQFSAEMCRRVFVWVYQPPCEDLDGFFCRAIIACWVFIPQLRGETLEEISSHFGKKKQSLGRWTPDFQKTFPELKHLEHFKHELYSQKRSDS